MKKKLFTIILAVATLHGYAQNMTGFFLPRANDEVNRQQVAYVAADEGTQNMVWDFRGLKLLDDKYTSDYTMDEAHQGLLVGTEFNTRLYYAPSVDSLLLCGYENNLMRVSYDQPELLLHLPLTYGDRQQRQFHGTVAYSERQFLRVFGTSTVEVDATGMMLLPSGDTLRHVSRVHLRELRAEQSYQQLSTEGELTSYVDSQPYTQDSIRTRMNDGRTLMQTDTYQWYAAGYRYPILETVTVGLQGQTQFPAYTLYCSPEEQRSLYDEENEQLRQLLAEIDCQEGSTHDNAYSQSPMSRCEISINSGYVTISYDLTENAQVCALICNTQGMLFRQQEQTSTAGSGHQLTISCQGLRSGEYILYLNVNGMILSRKVNL